MSAPTKEDAMGNRDKQGKEPKKPKQPKKPVPKTWRCRCAARPAAQP